jgi:hypothetical protein
MVLDGLESGLIPGEHLILTNLTLMSCSWELAYL